ncbi:MAG: RDD family protein [Verrucomicrobiota bacterium]
MKTMTRFATLALAFALCLSTHPLRAQDAGSTANTNSADSTGTVDNAAPADNDSETNAAPAPSHGLTRRPNSGPAQQLVVFGHSVELKAGDTAEVVVVIGGSAAIHGRVNQAVVVIGGSADIDGEVGQDVVAIAGSLRIHQGAIIHQNAVCVLGTLTIGPNAEIGRDAVAVGGQSQIDSTATVHGQKVNVAGPVIFGGFEWLGKWFRECVLKLRPLAPGVGWVWVVGAAFVLIYFLAALLFPKAINGCARELETRPLITFFIGLLTAMLIPIFIGILAFTGIGLLIVPFLHIAVLIIAAGGKAALLQVLGGLAGRPVGLSRDRHPLLAFWIGVLLLAILYIVPVLGLVAYGLFLFWGLGAGVAGIFAARNQPAPPTANPLAPQPQPFSQPPPFAPAAAGAAPGFAPGAGEGVPPTAGFVPPPLPTPQLPAALAYPRAGFWLRAGAAFLDWVIICILSAITGHLLGWLIALAYFSGMWAWKGMTIGGIVLRIQVVRQDGSPLTFLACLVRALAAAFSALVLFLGFFWIGWDPEKQGWHDKIAGTVVARLPQTLPLVCI